MILHFLEMQWSILGINSEEWVFPSYLSILRAGHTLFLLFSHIR